MAKAIINIKTDPETKEAAQKLAETLGLSLSALVNTQLREAIRTKKVVLDASEGYQPTDYLEKILEESEKDSKAGFVSPTFDNANDAIAWLEDPNAKYKNGLHKEV